MSPFLKSGLLSLFVLSLINCSGNSTGSEEPGPDPLSPIAVHDEVPADDRLETVTWNIEWFGSTSNGPSDERLQLANVLSILDTLEADLYALQEIYGQAQIDSLTKYMPGYEGVVADHISWVQKTAFLYNTNTISNVSTDVIDESEGMSEYDFAGRLPFVLNFDYTHSGGTQSFMAIVIHAKCCTGSDDYARRKAAADSLYNYLQEQHPDDFIVLMGDYNDDLDESIHGSGGSYEETPYISFKNDSESFTVVTGSLGADGTSSTIGYDDVIDHITYSNEVMPFYLEGSAEVLQEAEEYVTSYGSTTSDHYPVRAVIRFQN